MDTIAVAEQTMIREARFYDVPTLCRLGNELRKETVWGTVPFPVDYPHIARVFLERLHDASHQILVAEREHQVIGFCAGQVRRHAFVPTILFLEEWAWWVPKDERTGTIGRALRDQLIDWAKAQGAVGWVYGIPRHRSHHRNTELMVWEFWGTAHA